MRPQCALQKWVLDKENFTKQCNEKVKHCKTVIQNKIKEVQIMQRVFDEKMKQHAAEKKSFDDAIVGTTDVETQKLMLL